MASNKWLKVVVVSCAIIGIVGVGIYYFSQKAEDKNEIKETRQDQNKSNLDAKFKTSFLDQKNERIENFQGIYVEDIKVVNAQKGYMRMRIDHDYLNTTFNKPVTLTNNVGPYEPMLLTFSNNKVDGPRISVVSPKYKTNRDIYFNKYLKFSGPGAIDIFYSKDIICEFYYSNPFFYFSILTTEVTFPRDNGKVVKVADKMRIGTFKSKTPGWSITAMKEFEKLKNIFQ